MKGHHRAWIPALILVATVAQLAIAEFVPGIERFEGKAFGARLLAYPALMLLVPVVWWWAHRHTNAREKSPPYGGFALVMLPFLVDVTGNTLDLYDRIVAWDDLNHFGNWALLCSGLGIILLRGVRPRWLVVLAVTGLGAILAIGWEAGEWFTFIRHGTEIETAYEDTLGDLVLGTCGAFVAGLFVAGTGRSPDMT